MGNDAENDAFHRRHTAGPPCKGCFMWAHREPRQAPRGFGRVGPHSPIADFRRTDVLTPELKIIPLPPSRMCLGASLSALSSWGMLLPVWDMPWSHITFYVCTLGQPQEKKKHFTSTGKSKLPSALLLLSATSFTSSVC